MAAQLLAAKHFSSSCSEASTSIRLQQIYPEGRSARAWPKQVPAKKKNCTLARRSSINKVGEKTMKNAMKHYETWHSLRCTNMRPCYIETSNTPPEAFPIKCRMVSAEKASPSRGTLDMVTIRSARASFPIRSSRKRTWFLASRTRGVIVEFPASPQSCQKWINWEGYTVTMIYRGPRPSPAPFFSSHVHGEKWKISRGQNSENSRCQLPAQSGRIDKSRWSRCKDKNLKERGHRHTKVNLQGETCRRG